MAKTVKDVTRYGGNNGHLDFPKRSLILVTPCQCLSATMAGESVLYTAYVGKKIDVHQSLSEMRLTVGAVLPRINAWHTYLDVFLLCNLPRRLLFPIP